MFIVYGISGIIAIILLIISVGLLLILGASGGCDKQDSLDILLFFDMIAAGVLGVVQLAMACEENPVVTIVTLVLDGVLIIVNVGYLHYCWYIDDE